MTIPAEEYEHPNTDLDLPIETGKTAPLKDPATGRFVSPDAPAVTAPVPSEVPATPAPAKHPASLARQAESFGLDPAEYTTPGLYAAVHTILQHRLDLTEQFARERTLQAPTPQPAPKADEPALDSKALIEAGYDPAIVRELQEGVETRKELKALREELKQSRERDQQRQQQAAMETLDLAFDALPEHCQKRLGKGPIAELPNGPEKKARIALVRAAGLDPNNLPSPGATRKALREAADMLLPAPEPAAAPAATAAGAGGYGAAAPTNGHVTKETWDKGTVAAPTARKGAPEPKGLERAKQEAEKYAAEQVTAEDAEILAGVPD